MYSPFFSNHKKRKKSKGKVRQQSRERERCIRLCCPEAGKTVTNLALKDRREIVLWSENLTPVMTRYSEAILLPEEAKGEREGEGQHYTYNHLMFTDAELCSAQCSTRKKNITILRIDIVWNKSRKILSKRRNIYREIMTDIPRVWTDEYSSKRYMYCQEYIMVKWWLIFR